jgi:hypothetical protein
MTRRCLGAAPRESRGIDLLKHQIQGPRIVAAVIGDRRTVAHPAARHIRHLIRADEAAAAHVLARQGEAARDAIGETLQHEGGVRAAGAAYRRRRHEIGQHDVDCDVERLERIRPGEGRQRRRRQDEAVGRIGAVVVDAAPAHTEHAALRITSDLQRPELVALLRRSQEMLLPVLDPLDRAPAGDRRERDG